MTDTKNQAQVMNLQVADGLTVEVLPNPEHEFLIPTADVAKGYGVSPTTFRRHKQEHSEDLVAGKHFITVVQNLNAGCKSETYSAPPTKRTYWTKRGVIRMGFFIRSERARLFRDWAEDLIIRTSEAQKEINAEAIGELGISTTSYFDQWLKYGDLKKVAEMAEVNYASVRRIRKNPSISRRITQMIYDVCRQNQHEARSRMHPDKDTIELLLRVEDKAVRLGLWNKLLGGAGDGTI